MSEPNFRCEKEYFALFDNIKDFDQRLVTIKGWGVTLSLAAIVIGFQQQHYGVFLVSLLSGIAFWIIEAAVKKHQMRHYLRMREIEVENYKESGKLSTPLIDWSWRRAPYIFKGKAVPIHLEAPQIGKFKSYSHAWILPHVLFPHIISVSAGGILFFLGCLEKLNMPL